MADLQVEFLTNYETLISYLLQFSTDWSKFNTYQFDNNLSKKNIIGVLDSFTETKVTKDDFYQWFVELFLKFIELRPKNLSLFDDGLALKVLSLSTLFRKIILKVVWVLVFFHLNKLKLLIYQLKILRLQLNLRQI